MADRWLLESGAPDGWLLEDGSGVFLLEDGLSFRDRLLALTPTSYWRQGEPSGTTMTDYQGVNNGTYVNTPTLGVAATINSTNTAVTYALASSEYAVGKTGKILGGQANASFVTLYKSNNSAHQAIYTERSGTLASTLWKVEVADLAAGQLQITWQSDNALGYDKFSGGPNILDNVWHLLAVTVNATLAQLYVDGVPVGTFTLSESAAGPFAGAGIEAWLGADKFDGPGVSGIDGTLDETAVWAGTTLSPTQVLWLWGSINNLEATGTTLDVPLATLTTSTFAPSLVRADRLDVPVASLVTSTKVPSIGDGRVVPLATLVTATFAPVLVSGTSLIVPLATLTTATFAPSLVRADRYTVPLTALTISTFAPSLVRADTLTVPVTALVITPLAPFLRSALTVPVTALATTTFAPVLFTGTNLTVPLATLTTATFAPSLVRADRYTVPLTALTTATFAPSLVRADRLDVPVASLTTTTFAPTLTLGSTTIVVTPGVSALVLTAYPPEVLTPIFFAGSALERGPTGHPRYPWYSRGIRRV